MNNNFNFNFFLYKNYQSLPATISIIITYLLLVILIKCCIKFGLRFVWWCCPCPSNITNRRRRSLRTLHCAQNSYEIILSSIFSHSIFDAMTMTRNWIAMGSQCQLHSVKKGIVAMCVWLLMLRTVWEALTKLQIVSDELDSDIRRFFPSRRMYDKLVWFDRLIWKNKIFFFKLKLTEFSSRSLSFQP